MMSPLPRLQLERPAGEPVDGLEAVLHRPAREVWAAGGLGVHLPAPLRWLRRRPNAPSGARLDGPQLPHRRPRRPILRRRCPRAACHRTAGVLASAVPPASTRARPRAPGSPAADQPSRPTSGCLRSCPAEPASVNRPSHAALAAAKSSTRTHSRPSGSATSSTSRPIASSVATACRQYRRPSDPSPRGAFTRPLSAESGPESPKKPGLEVSGPTSR